MGEFEVKPDPKINKVKNIRGICAPHYLILDS